MTVRKRTIYLALFFLVAAQTATAEQAAVRKKCAPELDPSGLEYPQCPRFDATLDESAVQRYVAEIRDYRREVSNLYREKKISKDDRDASFSIARDALDNAKELRKEVRRSAGE